MLKRYSFVFAAVLMAFTFSNCGGSSSSSSTTTTTSTDLSDTEATFPIDASVTSPLDTGSSTESSVSAFLSSGTAYTTAFTATKDELEAKLAGTAYSNCVFDPVLYLASTTDAECYGPIINYTGHPDATNSTEASGQLPPGDLGIWLEDVEGSEEACAAGQLNGRINGMSDRVMAGLQTAASMRCVINVDTTVDLPSSSTTELTAAMNTFVDSVDSSEGLDGVSFDSASMTHAVVDSEDEYTYTFVMDFDQNVDGDLDDDGDQEDIEVTLVHRSSTSSYRGRLTLEYPSTKTDGNCVGDVVVASSLLYARDSSADISAETRDAVFCGAASAQFVDGIVDNTANCGEGETANCWKDDFDLFIAAYDKDTQAGNFAYSWSAGGQDSNVRTLNVTVGSESGADGTVEATAYFGYGPQMATSALGNIQGMICNWAGPQNSSDESHTLVDFVQKQVMQRSATSAFLATSSSIAYAPLEDCAYATSDGGFGGSPFQMDADLDGTVDAHQSYPNELEAVTLDADGNAILDGFTLPEAPENF